MNIKRTKQKAVAGLIFNLAYSTYNGALGVIYLSPWFVASCGYYLLLGLMRFTALWGNRKQNIKKEYRLMGVSGGMLLFLSLILSVILYISLKEERATAYGTIIMITIAAYTFTKITLAIIKGVKYRSNPSPTVKTLHYVRYAEIAVSVFTMQKSMLVSFGEASKSDVFIFNLLTGLAVCIFASVLGILLIMKSKGKGKMAKSKLVQTGEKIADKTVTAYKAVENTVVSGYKKVEKTVVDGYTKIEDAFVDKYLTKEGETVEQAKERLKNEKK